MLLLYFWQTWYSKASFQLFCTCRCRFCKHHRCILQFFYYANWMLHPNSELSQRIAHVWSLLEKAYYNFASVFKLWKYIQRYTRKYLICDKDCAPKPLKHFVSFHWCNYCPIGWDRCSADAVVTTKRRCCANAWYTFISWRLFLWPTRELVYLQVIMVFNCIVPRIMSRSLACENFTVIVTDYWMLLIGFNLPLLPVSWWTQGSKIIGMRALPLNASVPYWAHILILNLYGCHRDEIA